MPYFYLASLIPSILVIYGNSHGGILTLLNTVFMLGFLALAEFISLQDKSSSQNKNQEFIPGMILILHPVVHTLGVLSLCYFTYNKTIGGFWILPAVLSTGLNSGLSGIIAAHELIHRKEKWARYLGIWNLWLVNYGHYYVEHVRVHHRYVGTSKDGATAFLGESIYRFYLRTIKQQFLSAYHADKKFVFRLILIETITMTLVGIFLGPLVLIAYLGNSLVAVLLLEYANYIEHYGLTREEGGPIRAHHSWQSDAMVTRVTLMELSRHSDHHLRASKKFQKLDSVPGTPEMPYGYFGMFFIALVPPLWFKTVNPLIKKEVS